MELIQSESNYVKNVKRSSLEDVMRYRNEDVLDGFMQSFEVSKEDAETIFLETLKWFWYCSQEETIDSRAIDSSLVIIDEMWHTFILYTKDYTSFCLKFFGKYIHHAPTTNSEKMNFKTMSDEDKKIKKRKQLELVHDVLGKSTFITWYFIFPEKYSRNKILELRKK